MLKNFKPVSLILCAGALCFSGSMYANIAPVEQGTSISQQNGKVTGTVDRSVSCRERHDQWYDYRYGR